MAKLGDLLEVVVDHRGKTPKKLGVDFTETGVPVISAKLVSGGAVDFASARYVSKETWERWMPVRLKTGDVLLTSEAPLGRTAEIKSNAPVVLGQRLFALRGKHGVLDSRYLRYWLDSEFGQSELYGRATGTTVIGIKQSLLLGIEIDVPNFDTQIAISSVLGALDDKIAVNQKVIKKALELTFFFSSCKDGVEAKLDDIAEFISRGVVPKYAEEPGKLIINQRCIRGGLVDLSQARWTSILPKDPVRLVHQYDVLINSTGQGTLGRMAPWIRKSESDNEVVTDTHITTVRFNPEKVNPAFAAVVLASRESAMANLAEGSTGQTELKRELVRNFRINLPPLEVQNEVSLAFHSLFAIVVAMEDENEVLIRTRDELLPLLMSGKISVREAEEAVAEVGVEKREDEGNVQ